MAYLAVLSIVWTVIFYVCGACCLALILNDLFDEGMGEKSRNRYLVTLGLCVVFTTLGSILNVYAATHTMYLPG